jgi:hypothetical protein
MQVCVLTAVLGFRGSCLDQRRIWSQEQEQEQDVY